MIIFISSLMLFVVSEKNSSNNIKDVSTKEVILIEIIRQSDNEKWSLSEKDIIDKFMGALNNRQRTDLKFELKGEKYSLKICYIDNSIEEYSLWIGEDDTVSGVLMNNATTWFIDSKSNSTFKDILKQLQDYIKLIARIYIYLRKFIYNEY